MNLKLSIAAFCCLLSVFSSSAQSKKDMKKNRVKSVREIETTIKDGKEVTADNSFFRYDADNNVTEEIDMTQKEK